ncbi:MAG: hypothetical protein PV345_03145 [Wolbachia sp.]|nr:hypothetical protein [Wolbachia sp.]
MHEIDFINVDQPLDLVQETFDISNGYIKITENSFDEHTPYHKITDEILDKDCHVVGNLVACRYFSEPDPDSHKLSVKYNISLEVDMTNILPLEKDI